MVKSLVNSVRKVRPFVFTVAYALVLSDLLNLAQEVAQEFVLSRFFPEKQSTVRVGHVNMEGKWVDETVEQTSEFENVSANVPDYQSNGNNSQEDVKSYQVVNGVGCMYKL